MQEIPCKPPLFKVGDRVTVLDAEFCRLVPQLNFFLKQIVGKTGTITEFIEGKPVTVDDKGYMTSLGSASFYHVILDIPPLNLKNEPVTTALPLHDSELKKLEDI